MNTAGIVVLVIALAAIAGIIGWIVSTRIRAQRLGVSFCPPCFPTYPVYTELIQFSSFLHLL
jgi:hypothetical protein